MSKQVIKDALWVDVGDYTVMRDGRIFKRNWHNTGKTKEVKQSKHIDGYLCFRYNGKIVKSHRFIAEAYISNPDNLPEINHKSEVKHDNSVLGLEFCDRSYNINFGTRNEQVRKAKINRKAYKKVYQYTLDGSFVREWPSVHEVERQLGWSIQSISMCCRDKRKTAHGYLWSYERL